MTIKDTQAFSFVGPPATYNTEALAQQIHFRDQLLTLLTLKIETEKFTIQENGEISVKRLQQNFYRRNELFAESLRLNKMINRNKEILNNNEESWGIYR